MKQVKSIGAVVHSNGRFLLLQYAAGHWDFVKGHVEKGESEVETMVRELCEETGISQFEVMPGFREEINYVYKNGKETVKKTAVFYLIETKETKIKLSNEHTSFAWLPFKEALGKITYENSKQVLEKANRFLEKV